MIYKIMNIEELNDDIISTYFSMLSPVRQKKIAMMKNVRDRKIAFCSEILARKCLSELCEAPEFSFQLLCNADSRSIVGNFEAEISIVSCKNYVACAASRDSIGISLVAVAPFSFDDAQQIFTDTELRAVFSDSSYSFSELISMEKCIEKNVIQRFALLRSLKEAHFYSTGRGIRSEQKRTLFEFTSEGMKCSDVDAEICKSYIDKEKEIAISIIKRCKK